MSWKLCPNTDLFFLVQQRIASDTMPKKYGDGTEDERYHSARISTYAQNMHMTVSSMGMTIFANRTAKDASFLEDTWVNRLTGEHRVSIGVRPGTKQ